MFNSRKIFFCFSDVPGGVSKQTFCQKKDSQDTDGVHFCNCECNHQQCLFAGSRKCLHTWERINDNMRRHYHQSTSFCVKRGLNPVREYSTIINTQRSAGCSRVLNKNSSFLWLSLRMLFVSQQTTPGCGWLTSCEWLFVTFCHYSFMPTHCLCGSTVEHWQPEPWWHLTVKHERRQACFLYKWKGLNFQLKCFAHRRKEMCLSSWVDVASIHTINLFQPFFQFGYLH